MNLFPHKFARRALALTLLCVLMQVFAPIPAAAIIDASLQMQLGNPSGATTDPSNTSHYLILRAIEAIDYSATLNQPNWASWNLTSDDVGPVSRSPDFFTDTNLPPGFYRVTTADYNGVGNIAFNRGHMCPSEDRTDTTNDNQMTFFMSNIIPQAADNNQQPWKNFEEYCRTLASAGNEVLIICGPSGFGTNVTPSGKVPIPNYTWKVAVAVPLGSGTALERISVSNRVIALRIPNTNGVSNSWQNYITTARQIETDTGFTFFTAVPPEIASAFRYRVDGLTNPPPQIFSFTPPIAEANASVIILGTNFTSALAVRFNGASAVFSVDSPTQITATVPTNATAGAITVTTLSGTASSSGSFSPNTSGSTDLMIALAHSGAFKQGDTNATITITVTNIGTLATSGAIIVSNQLPAGLFATSLTGTGWSIDLGNLTATRSDSFAPGEALPPITLTVTVAGNATASVTNIATVICDGDDNPSNDTSSDSIQILPSAETFVGTIAGWDVSTLSNYGPSPFAPATNAGHISVTGLTRGSGVGTNTSGAARAWGGVGFTNVSASTAIASSQVATFSITANPGYTISLSSISKFDYRRSGTGPSAGVLQFRLGNGAFTDIANLPYTVSTSSGGSLGPFDLSGIAALQNIGAGTNVTFRIANYGGGPSGTWYIFDVASSSAPDLAIQGTVAPVTILTPIESWRQQWFGTTSNSGNAADDFVVTTDGMPNLLKYALGLDPWVPANSPEIGDISTGFLRISTARNPNATDVSLSVIVSGDLRDWTTNGTVIDENTPTFFRAHDAVPIASGTNRFMRLRAAHP